MDISDEDMKRRYSIAYPMEVGSQYFAPIPIKSERDIQINIARKRASDEYNRLSELISVIKKQADALVERVKCTEEMIDCRYSFKPVVGREYFVYFDVSKGQRWLSIVPPTEFTALPESHTFVGSVVMCADGTWEPKS